MKEGKGFIPKGVESVAEGAEAPDRVGRRPVFHSLSVCAGCECSGDDFGSVNVEAFELTGELYCEECADQIIEDHGQFGVGA